MSQRVKDISFSSPIQPWAYEEKSAKPADNESNSTSTVPEAAESKIEHGEYVKTHGLHWFVASLLVIGDMAGAGIVALPTAVLNCTFFVGIGVCIVMAAVMGSTSLFLGHSWLILLKRWPEYRTHCRKPYADIGFRAMGLKAKILVSIVLNITQFGVCVVFLLLAAKNIHDFIESVSSSAPDVCWMLLIVGVVLLPLTFLKSPERFWWVIVAGMCSTFIAVVLIVTGTGMDYKKCSANISQPKFSLLNFFTALGTITFAFSGHTVFPTIQIDMRRPAQFTRASNMAFTVVCLFYMPVLLIAYMTYGDSLRDSIINSIQTSWIQQTVNLMIAAHCTLTVILEMNVISQEVEEIFRLPQEFGLKRVFCRVSIMAAVVFVGESVPNFGPFLDLVGGSTLTIICMIFPAVFYLWLVARNRKMEENGRDDGPCTIAEVLKYNNKWILAICAFMTVVGLIGGSAATYSAFLEITDTRFEVPCYVKAFQHKVNTHVSTATNCCGLGRNISVAGNDPKTYCNAYK